MPLPLQLLDRIIFARSPNPEIRVTAAHTNRANEGRLPKKGLPAWGAPFLEQATGIEPAASAWEAEVLPLDYACEQSILYTMRGRLSMPPHEKAKLFAADFDIFRLQSSTPNNILA